MLWQAIVDFDGTISRTDTTDALLARFADPMWEAVEAEWVAGRIGARECMERQVAMLQITPRQLEDFINSVAFDPAFRSFVRQCERYDVRLRIVSDGLGRIVSGVLKRAGVGWLPVAANHLEHVHEDRWRLTSPFQAAGCPSGTCKCAVAGDRGRMTLLIGDGRSDYCLASSADHVFAKDSLLAHCREQRISVQPFADFSEVITLTEELITVKTERPAAFQQKAYVVHA